MKRLLLLLPTRGYRAQAFIDAATKLNVKLTVASEESSSMESLNPEGLLALDFGRPEIAAQQAREFAKQYPLDAVVGVDDATVLLQARLAGALHLPSTSISSVSTARNKYRMRQTLRDAGLPGPPFRVFSLEHPPEDAAGQIPYPCVLKPLILSGSRGVIRANNPAEFVAAFHRVAAILKAPDIAALGEDAQTILVEGYVEGHEVALEGLIMAGQLHPLALFDKPDPLEGPFFEEALYITPSRLPIHAVEAVHEAAVRAAEALNLTEGPVHAEMRMAPSGPVILEINPRSIGGRCSQALRFGVGVSLEEIILRRALGMELPTLVREEMASGVLMIPTPRAGVLQGVCGQEAAGAVPGITDTNITAHPGQRLIPLPEGSAYLGFIFARADTPDQVEAALRAAHARLRIDISQ